jgi:SnoaL-like protein
MLSLVTLIVEVERDEVGVDFVDALGARDFARLKQTLDDDVHLRALVPTGLVELDGPEAVGGRFERWFGTTRNLVLLDASTEAVADVVHVAYRLHLDDHPFSPGSGPRLIEQHLFCHVERGRITSIDLVCSGFRAAVSA